MKKKRLVKDKSAKSGAYGPAKRLRISLCMIVRDEESFLPACLASVAGAVDEIVIVDTGSKDNTVKIAEEFGARVFHHPWANDFARHKNQAIDYATGDWVFVIDADEVLQEKSIGVLRRAVLDRAADAIVVTILSFSNNKASRSWESKVRLFRRTNNSGCKIRYQGAIHEQVINYRAAKAYPIYLDHYGYDLPQQAREAKFERNIGILKQLIDKTPDSYWHHHNLAVAYASNFMFDDAISEGRAALRAAVHDRPEVINLAWTYYILSASHFKLEQMDEAQEYAAAAVKLSPLDLDGQFMLVLVHHTRKEWESLLVAAKCFLNMRKALESSCGKFAYRTIHSANETWRVRLGLADYYLNHKDSALAVKEFEKALEAAPQPSECYSIMASMCNEAGHSVLAEEVFERILALGFERGDLSSADKWYSRAIELDPNAVDVALRSAIINLRCGDLEQCVAQCDLVLKSLGMPRNIILNNLADLTQLLLQIGEHLHRSGRPNLAADVANAALNHLAGTWNAQDAAEFEQGNGSP